VGAFESLLVREPSSVAIECLVPASLYELPYERVCELQERDPFWQRFGRLLAERLYVKKARREAELLLDSASQRYERFLERHREVVDEIPGYQVAAYLGITAEALSRIRRKRTLR
jgi:CRP-like cAMP-binding protein